MTCRSNTAEVILPIAEIILRGRIQDQTLLVGSVWGRNAPWIYTMHVINPSPLCEFLFFTERRWIYHMHGHGTTESVVPIYWVVLMKKRSLSLSY